MKRFMILGVFMCIGNAYSKNNETSALYTLDFEASLGKNDQHFSPYFYNFLNHLDQENSPWVGIAFKPIRPLYTFLKELYEKNKLSKVTSQPIPKIPLKVHQIWLGSPFPEKYKKWQQTWQTLPGWEYKLWTDEDVKTMRLDNQEYYDNSNNYGERSDILRMEILYRYGGVYVDTDFECLQPELFTMLNHCYDFYSGLYPIDSEFHVANALIASIPHHPILKGYITELAHNYNSAQYNGWHPILMRTGPGFFTKMVFEYAGKKHRDIIFPPSLFYPLGTAQWHTIREQSKEIEIAVAKAKATVVKPESLAIHYWQGSWTSE